MDPLKKSRIGARIVAAVAAASLFAFPQSTWAQCEEWRPLAADVNSWVASFMVYQGELVAGGSFTNAGGVSVRNIASWNGSTWRRLGSGTSGAFVGHVMALTVHGDDLVAGGWFTNAGGQAAPGVARWDGSSWHPYGAGINDIVNALVVYDGELIAGHSINISRWDGTAWHPLGGGVNSSGRAFLVYDGDLIAGGEFTRAGGQVVNHIARWDGATWLRLGSGMDGGVFALEAYDDEIVAAGRFTMAGGQPAGRIASWDGTAWTELGGGVRGGLPGGFPHINALTTYNHELIAAGMFTEAGETAANMIAAWNGAEWRALDLGMDNEVLATASYDGVLTAAGYFGHAGGQAARIAQWRHTTAAPVAICGGDILVQATSGAGAEVMLDGTGAHAPDGNPIHLTWHASGVVFDDPHSATPTGQFPIGRTMATLTVADGCGRVATCDTYVTVEDATPPEVFITTDHAMLWPSNHKMREVMVVVTTSSECIGPGCAYPLMVQVRSNEADNAAGSSDGNTTGDVGGQDGFAAPVDITNLFTFDPELDAWVAFVELRAERDGSGTGRCYGIEVVALENGTNVSMASCCVVVPHDRRGGN